MYKTDVENVVKNFAGECFRFWMKETNGDVLVSGTKATDDLIRITGNPNYPSGGSEEFKTELKFMKECNSQHFTNLVIQGFREELSK